MVVFSRGIIKVKGLGLLLGSWTEFLSMKNGCAILAKLLVDFPSCGVSDHSPAVISVGTLVSFGPKPFKFYKLLAGK